MGRRSKADRTVNQQAFVDTLRAEGGKRLTRDLFTGNSEARAVRCRSGAADAGVGRGLKGVREREWRRGSGEGGGEMR